jgi:hypothetical protein
VATVPFPVSSNPFLTPIAAEAPDGTVFAAFASSQLGTLPMAAAGTTVYVVDGTQSPQVAEHPVIPMTALAADAGNLYVGGQNEILEYSRATGNSAGQWALPQPARLMTVAAGKLWAVLGTSVSSAGTIVEITPGSSGVTTVGTDAANVTAIAGGSQGIYYVESGGATIVHISPDGTRQQEPTNQTVNQQLSGPAAVQAVSVIGNQLLLIHDAGQGLDSSSQTYDLSTLSGPQGSAAPGTAGGNHALSTLAGTLDLVDAGAEACSGDNCVGRYNLSSGAVTDAVTFPQSSHLSTLLGPYPAVIVLPSSGDADLARIG